MLRSALTASKFWHALLLLGLSILVVAVAACSDDDDDSGSSDGTPTPDSGEVSAEQQAVEDVLTQVFESDGTNSEYFFAHITDNALETILFSDREECQADPVDCIGEPGTVESISGTAISGDTATLTVAADFGTFDAGLVLEDGEWKVDSLQAASDDVPAGAAAVDLGLSEFNFIFDEAQIPEGGDFYLHVTNFGNQAHEVIVAPLGDLSLEDALAEPDEGEADPPVGFKVYIRPGQEVDMALDGALAPGRYAFVCFFPDTDDPEFTPHVEKGMAAEFTIN